MKRVMVNALMLLVACGVLAFLSITRGTLPISASQLWALINGEAARNIQLIVLEWRLPRVMMALLIGAALGVSGAIFQSLLRNPLGSPDILGFNTGAYSGVLVALVLFQQNMEGMTLAALLGGLLTAGVVWLFSWRNGVETFRLIIVGISVRALLMALNSWLIISASLEAALSAGLWSAGSLNGITWAKTTPVITVLLLALLATSMLARRMRLLEMGDDTACALGVPVERSRVLLMLTGVILTAASTALVGPVSFIALLAPQIARRLCGGIKGALPLAALCGALLLTAADYAAQHFFLPYQLPVGVITVSLGGLYLIALLVREARRQ
ncbi:iron-enterobactin ABC transporter permease [Pantoea agglomerans]|uniref:Ferric enterobactin transport system permease protein fepG n=1 Tax=Enterobacter agglomerans TaxID=549 RepID=A0A379AME0_ENTAG|nr:iron-enterobactin ABC transporter permease [Pantoea agglomerans]MDQ0550198.1 ABC-type enterobactin transport system permease subunit [Pantoea agglomerans]MRT07237.1 iron-enterobactin ABC transporter permease [Pantoea agglomerans]QXB58700.1 iron-enterobactin ABC transporter permease [Pantoea agglomerans]WNK44027.1 iron-enterobactin ABC transporter permease [Pantoea agglomerans]SUB18742.1 Ferric enterobactin transport system permease protein fepG [Pantoea agglomerans]